MPAGSHPTQEMECCSSPDATTVPASPASSTLEPAQSPRPAESVAVAGGAPSTAPRSLGRPPSAPRILRLHCAWLI